MLRLTAQRIVRGWGQSKVIEDSLQRLRDAEQRGVTNRRRELTRQWGLLCGRTIVKLHGRTAIKPRESPTLSREVIGKDMFNFKSQTPSLDGDSITTKASWPSLTAQSSQT